MKVLRKGYSTGVHASFAFKSALEIFLSTGQTVKSSTFKMDNDDLDVTKNCEIVVTIAKSRDALPLNTLVHKPYILRGGESSLELYAGNGVGVVTKDGLKPPKGYPAINPKPLEVFQEIFSDCLSQQKLLYASVSVIDGEKIAKQTANAKVGVIGGISILGTTGFVKPISASAYIDSIAQELNFAQANGYKTIVFTLGSSAFKKASTERKMKDFYIIEIGNFIYDGIQLAVDLEFDAILLIVGIGKSVKIAQGCKNTHNRFGGIDFAQVQEWIDIDISECLTIKRVRELLGEDASTFDTIVLKKTEEQLYEWFGKKIEVKLAQVSHHSNKGSK